MFDLGCGDFRVSLEEVDDGFKVYIVGDKEVLRPKLEAMEAYLNFQQKAKAAGWNFGSKQHRGYMSGHGFHGAHGCQGGHGMYAHGPDKVKKFVGHFQRAFKDAIDDMKKE